MRVKKNNRNVKMDVRIARQAVLRQSGIQTRRRGIRKLNEELVELRKENALLRKNLISLLHEDLPDDKSTLLKQAVQGPSIVKLVEEMERRGE